MRARACAKIRVVTAGTTTSYFVEKYNNQGALVSSVAVDDLHGRVVVEPTFGWVWRACCGTGRPRTRRLGATARA